MKKIVETIRLLEKQDPNLCVDRKNAEETFGHNPDYLQETYGITKSDLIRLERLGLAAKARYATRNSRATTYYRDSQGMPIAVDGPHRVRWLIFKEEEEE